MEILLFSIFSLFDTKFFIACSAVIAVMSGVVCAVRLFSRR